MSVNISAYLEFCKSLLIALLWEAVARRKLASDAFSFLKYAVRNILYHTDIAAGCSIT